MSIDGIDLSKSSWDNPDGFVRAPRPVTPVTSVAACEAAGPDGWVCDLKPNHPGTLHRAEGGPSWEMAEVTTLAEAEPRFITGRTLDPRLAEIHALAVDGLRAESPAAWILALDKIRAVVAP